MYSYTSVFFILLLGISVALRTSQTFEKCTPFHADPSIPMSEVTLPIQESYTIIELDPSSGARCLDGSNYKFYYSKGSGTGANKFMFYFQGGAFCGVEGNDFIESCFERSQFILGSSLFWGRNGTTQTMPFAMGFFSSVKKDNPEFWNWNKILINYCDGSNHQGYSEKPINFNGKDLWFRGYNNTMGVFNYAKDHFGLFKASQIILSGVSAGSQAFYMWAPYLQNLIPINIKLFGISDSGLFLDVYSPVAGCYYFRYLTQKVAYYTGSAQLDLFKNCTYKTSATWKCLLPEYNYGRIAFPVFVINSFNDATPLSSQVGIDCVLSDPINTCSPADLKIINDYKTKITAISNMIKTTKYTWGFWIRACFEHVLSQTWGWYGDTKNVWNSKLNKSMNLRDALSYWYNGGIIMSKQECFFSDVVDWSNNPSCNVPLSAPMGPMPLPLPPLNGNFPGL